MRMNCGDKLETNENSDISKTDSNGTKLSHTKLERKAYSLVLLLREEEILLGYKKRGFGKGKWNGFGGKLEKDEDPVVAAIREMNEECEVQLEKDDLEKIGLLEFIIAGQPILMEVHIFKAHRYTGMPTESDEMIPKWFNIKDLPYESMWPDDLIWYPLMFENKKFKGEVHLSEDEKIIYNSIKPIDIL
ncbi:7,8-dihydro-8-oxoguanine triphosphatase [Armadillidium vulgare]|nr:7,8-dihydro-8-oxoguanine triphosphatase [Armadillidium vulgare]RXG70208.1 7,8-dihydro-8-oxoguanine triphosphatase [Armadillidium vulgare]